MTLRSILLGLFFTAITSLFVYGQDPCIANAGPDQNVCDNLGGIIGADTALPGTIYSWSVIPGNSTVTIANPNSSQTFVTPTTTTTYQLAQSNAAQNCADTDTVVITVFPDFAETQWRDSTICLGDTIFFDVESFVTPPGIDYVYSWDIPGGENISNANIPDPFIVPANTGTNAWTVTITDTFTNCQEIIPIIITVIPLNVVAVPPADIINPGQWVALSAFTTNTQAPPVIYTWEPDLYINCLVCDDPQVRPEETVTYTVTGVDQDGCIGTATVTIVTDSLLIPNVFSPNGDGINDVLTLNYWGDDWGDYQILIYDRWGRKVFETKDTQLFWNGQDSNGQDLPEGVYYLYVRIGGDTAIPTKDKNKAYPVTLVR